MRNRTNPTTENYDKLPDYIFQDVKSVLDLGAGSCALMRSNKREFIEGLDIVGVDISPISEPAFPVIRADLRTWKAERTYDLVLALHVLEHIQKEYWSEILSHWLNIANNWFVLEVPYRQPVWQKRLYKNNPQAHREFMITWQTIQEEIKIPFNRPLVIEFQQPRKWRNDGAPLLWAILRQIKRWVSRDPRARWFDKTRSIMIVIRK